LTSIVGVYCEDGVVIGTDSSTTFGDGITPTIEQPSEKLKIIGDRIIIAGTGQVGLGQRFISVVQKEHEGRVLEGKSGLEVAKIFSRKAIDDFLETHAPANSYGALVAYPTGSKSNLCEFAVKDFQPEMKNENIWYVSMGSARFITDTFLAFIREVFWNNGIPNVNDAIFAVYWTLQHAVAINPGGVNDPIRIAVLDKTSGKLRARILDDEDLFEHQENIDECKHVLRELQDKHQPEHESSHSIPEV